MKKYVVRAGVVALVLALALTGVAVLVAPNVSAAPGDPATSADSAYLGISVVTLNARIASQFNLSQTEGVVIASVTTGSPAEAADLKKGDLVKSVNGVAVKTAQEVVAEVRKAKVGAVVTLDVTRDGKQMTVKVTSVAVPTPQPRDTLPKRGGDRAPKATPQPRPTQVVPPELKPIYDIPSDQWFEHYYGSTETYKDGNGNVVTAQTIPGTVTAISATSITIRPNNPQSSGGAYTIDSTTIVRSAMRSSGADAIKVDDKVTVVVVGDSNHAAMISAGGVMRGMGGMGRGFMQPFGGHDFQMPFGRGGGMQFRRPNGTLQQPQTQPTTTDKGA